MMSSPFYPVNKYMSITAIDDRSSFRKILMEIPCEGSETKKSVGFLCEHCTKAAGKLLAVEVEADLLDGI
jgi:hypothetical protein